MKFKAKTNDKSFFKFTLSDDWFEKKFDYKKITNIAIETITAVILEDDIEIVQDTLKDCQFLINNFVYEEDDYDKYIKVFGTVEFSVPDDKFETFPDKLKEMLKDENLPVYIGDEDQDYVYEIYLGEFEYEGDTQPEIDEDYFFFSGFDQLTIGQ